MTATQNTWPGAGGPFTRLSDTALDTAILCRSQGWTFPRILRGLTADGHLTHGYDPSLLNHHVRARCAQRGIPVPGATTRPGARRSRRVSRGTSPRRFGVELEVVRLSQYAAQRALEAAGLVAVAEDYNHTTRTHWKCTTDATVSGCEVVSPPLTDWADVATAMKALRDAGGEVDMSCGLHVHHEVADLTGVELARLVRMYADHSDELDGLVAPSRRAARGRWCARLTTQYAQGRAAQLETCTGATLRERQTEARSFGLGNRHASDRYLTLNLHSFPVYGTVEFRQHQGTLSGAKGQAWVLLGQAMIQAAVDGRTFPTGGLVDGLAAAGALTDQTAEYLRRRAVALAA